VHLYTGFHPLTLELLAFASKAMLLPLLAGMVLFSGKVKSLPGRKFLLAALLFSWAGDLLLTRAGELFFMLGIGAFLLAQLSYAGVFLRTQGGVFVVPVIKRYPLIPMVYMVFGAVVFLSLRPELGEMELPVLVYCAAILVMGLTAANRFGRAGNRSFWMVWLGSTLFIASDTILAFNKFSDPIPLAEELWVMLTYCAAQFLIVRGLLVEPIE